MLEDVLLDPLLWVFVIALVVILLFVWRGVYLIKDNQVGIQRKKMMGKVMPQGQIIAIDGEVGIQADTLMPGLYWRLPFVWTIEKVDVVDIKPNEVGVVNSIDGVSMKKGRVLGDEVDSNNFQDARMFLMNKGTKGPQTAILKPGIYRINTRAFQIAKKPVISIDAETIGIVVAEDGQPLPSGYLIAPKPTEAPTEEFPNAKQHKHFQDGQAFLDSGGFRGTQQETLQPGSYYMNPLLFSIKAVKIQEVPPGYVAVVRSNIGIELEKSAGMPSKNTGSDDMATPAIEDAEKLLITDKTTRGILKDPVSPGKYNLNPLAYTPYLVPTSAVTIDWAGDTRIASTQPRARTVEFSSDTKTTEDFFKFSQLRVTSQDAFQLDVDVRMIIRIRPENAPFIIARFGSVENLIQQIVHPLIDSNFRNKAGNEKAIDFIKSRTRLQEEALASARMEFDKYHVEAQNLLISYILAPPALMATQTDKEIAMQQLEQYAKQAEAQEMRKDVISKTAQADQQGAVMTAQLSIQIEESKANALKKTAEGQRNAAMTLADGESYKIQKVAEGEAQRIIAVGKADAYKVEVMGTAEASATKAVGEAQADAYKAQADAIGGDNITNMKIVSSLSEGKMKLVPDTLITSNGEQGSDTATNLLSLFLVKATQDKKDGKTP